MQEFFRAYYEELQALHEEMEGVLAAVPAEALDWQPAPSLNSLAVLADHTAGAERYWIGDVAGQEHFDRVREQEFKTRGKDAQELRGRLRSVLEHSYGVLKGLSVEDLQEMRGAWRDDTDYSVAWALVHALQHTAMHVGHMQMVRDLWFLNVGDSD